MPHGGIYYRRFDRGYANIKGRPLYIQCLGQAVNVEF
jgi:hypothetical protein